MADGRGAGARTFPYGDVAVTGGLGFIGVHLCRALALRGVRVRCVDRIGTGTGAPAADSAAMLSPLPGITLVRADVGTDSLDAALDGADAVIHLAGLPGVRAGHRFSDLWRENTVTTVRLARETALRGQRFLLASTSSVYGDARELPTAETTRPAPLNAYAISKLAAEQACLTAVAQEGADAVIVRLFTVFGEGQRPDMAFARWIEAILCGRPIPLCARTVTARDFTYVGDAVAGLAAALERGARGEIYNVVGAGSTRLLDALALLESILGRPARVQRTEPFSGEATVTSGCGRKAAAHLGYTPRCSLSEGLGRQFASVLGTRRRERPERDLAVNAATPSAAPAREIARDVAPERAAADAVHGLRGRGLARPMRLYG